ncbi:MAG: hypothetical protein PGN34_20785 [Methylobacterium frigidaeris]
MHKQLPSSSTTIATPLVLVALATLAAMGEGIAVATSRTVRQRIVAAAWLAAVPATALRQLPA